MLLHWNTGLHRPPVAQQIHIEWTSLLASGFPTPVPPGYIVPTCGSYRILKSDMFTRKLQSISPERANIPARMIGAPSIMALTEGLDRIKSTRAGGDVRCFLAMRTPI